MTELSGADDSSDFHDNTILLENEDNESVHFSGFENSKFKTGDKVDYISLMGNNICAHINAKGEKNKSFI